MARGNERHGRSHLPGGSDPILGLASGIGPWQIPSLINGWANAGLPYDDIAYRSGPSGLEFKGHITGGTSGTIAFYLAAAYWPSKDLTTITDVVKLTPPPGAAQIRITASSGAVTVTTIV